MMFMMFSYFLRTRFPSCVYLRCLFQGFHLNKSEWAAPGRAEVAFAVLGFGEALVPALLPAPCQQMAAAL